MRVNVHSRLRRALAPVLGAALAVVGGIAITSGSAPDAQAREVGSGGQSGTSVSGGGPGRSITETMPSGVKVSISSPQIVLSSYTGKFLPQTGYSNPNAGFVIQRDWTAPAGAPTGAIWAMPDVMNQMLPYTPVEGKTVQLPQSYFNSNRFIDTDTFTLTLDPPVANPVFNMVMAGWAVGNGDNVYITKPFGKLTIAGAKDQAGSSIPVTMSKVAGWDYGGFNFIWRNGISMEDPTPANDLSKFWISGNNYSGGTTQFNSNGKPVSSISFVASNAWAQRGKLTTAYANNWGFQLNEAQSVSSLTRLTGKATYGDVTHAITDPGVHLGYQVAEGNRTRYVNGASSGTATDNSDAGMDALKGRTLAAATAGSPYTVDGIPVSNTSGKPLALQGWIDFNGNGRFDAGEGSQLVQVAPGQTSASLTWTVPADVAASGKQALRLRYGPQAQIQDQPSGLASMGEVEDYPAFVPTQSAPALQVVKTTATQPVTAGGQVVYYLDVTNRSAAPVDNIVVSDAIPSQITDFSATGTQGSVYNSSRDFSWMIGTLGAGATARVTITGTVSAATPTGQIMENTGTVSSPLGCSGNACSSTVRDAVEAGKLANISIVKANDLTGSNPLVIPGQSFTYSLTVTNNSGKDLTNLAITDQLPEGLTYVPATNDGWTFTGQTGTFTIAQLKAGDRQIIKVKVRVAGNATGQLRNVSVVSDIADPDACAADPTMDGCGVDPNPPTVDPAPLQISKMNDLGGGAIEAGTEFTYSITVRNAGSVTARKVKVTDVLPDELDFPAGTQEGWTISGKAAVADYFDLAPNETQKLTLQVVAAVATSENVVNTVMAEKDLAATGTGSLKSAEAQKAAAAVLDACIEGKTSGTCAADSKPIEEITAPDVTPVIDGGSVWDNPTPAATTPAATPLPTAAPAALKTMVWNGSGDTVKAGATYWEQLTLTNPGQVDQTVTVRTVIPAGTTFSQAYNYGWTISGNVATMANVTVKAGSNTTLYTGTTVNASAPAGQVLPVAFTTDGTNPSTCTAASSSCLMPATSVKITR